MSKIRKLPLPLTLVPRFSVFMTRCNSDMTEGRGAMVDRLCFTTPAAAEDYVDQQGDYDKGFWDIVEIPVIVTVPSKTDELKARALAKLTPEERKALGH